MAQPQIDLLDESAAHTQPDCGIVAGAELLTMKGYVPLSELRAGMRVVTRRGMRHLRAITSQTKLISTVQISPNCLGFARPGGELVLTEGQKVFVSDWRAQIIYKKAAIVLPVSKLIDGEFIRQKPRDVVDIYQLHFEHPEIVTVDGVDLLAALPVMSNV